MNVPKFLVVALCALSTTAHANDYVVNPAGSDESAGTVDGPWQTLQKAADNARAGDTVTVDDGTYAGFGCHNSGTAQHRIVFKARHKWGAKITGPDPAHDSDNIPLLSASYVTIDGFEVSGSKRAGIGVRTLHDDTGSDTRDDLIINCHCHHNGLPKGGAHDGIFSGFALNFTVQNCVVNDNGEHGIYVSNSADNPIIRGNESFNNRACGIQINADKNTFIDRNKADGLISNWLIEANIIHDNGVAGGAGINLDGDIKGICRNNLLYNNKATGIALYGIDGAAASHDNVIVNNTVYDPTSRRAALLIANGADNNIAFNNILYSGSRPGIEIGEASDFDHDYNLVSRIQGGKLSEHEASPDPLSLFANAAESDFQILARSAAHDAGIALFAKAAAPTVDLAAKPRPSDTAFDIGCYEIQGQAVAAKTRTAR